MAGDQGLLGQVEGRVSTVVAAWLTAQGARWRRAVTHVAIDMCQVFRCAVRAALPHAVIVVDHFHLVQLANTKLAELRRRLRLHQPPPAPPPRAPAGAYSRGHDQRPDQLRPAQTPRPRHHHPHPAQPHLPGHPHRDRTRALHHPPGPAIPYPDHRSRPTGRQPSTLRLTRLPGCHRRPRPGRPPGRLTATITQRYTAAATISHTHLNMTRSSKSRRRKEATIDKDRV
ncbi:transposase [Nonomuraea basaltis]|nr:transposase [Nonomuraea basaltis]